mmetsp:Transcript_65263/g.187740  ORF Transcript_65263/g.187740 Transcript_65263/m.187740 type:complete len:232 (-) Transcript_65263:653-1348(-)
MINACSDLATSSMMSLPRPLCTWPSAPCSFTTDMSKLWHSPCNRARSETDAAAAAANKPSKALLATSFMNCTKSFDNNRGNRDRNGCKASRKLCMQVTNTRVGGHLSPTNFKSCSNKPPNRADTNSETAPSSATASAVLLWPSCIFCSPSTASIKQGRYRSIAREHTLLRATLSGRNMSCSCLDGGLSESSPASEPVAPPASLSGSAKSHLATEEKHCSRVSCNIAVLPLR